MSKKNLRHVPVLSNWLRFFFILNQDIDMVYLITTAVTDSDGNDGYSTLKLKLDWNDFESQDPWIVSEVL